MDIKLIEKNLGTENLRSYLEEQINLGKSEAEIEINNQIESFLNQLNKEDLENELKAAAIISNLIYLPKIIFQEKVSLFNFFIENYKVYNTSVFYLQSDQDIKQDTKLIDFIIDYYSFSKFPILRILSQLKEIKNHSRYYYLKYYFELKSTILFEKLNEIIHLDSFSWDKNSFENGIVKFYEKLYNEKKIYIDKMNREISKIQKEHQYEIEDLKDELKYCEDDKESISRDLEVKDNFITKYIENCPTILLEMYFGDNQPFIFNFFNFLRTHKLMCKHGWSHFFSCFTIENNEIIYLQNEKDLKFIGRIFYNLINHFLLPKYANESFIRMKFYIDDKPIGKYFFTNHMNSRLKKDEYDYFEVVDSFFENQKKIFFIKQ